MERSEIRTNDDWVDDWKVLMTKAHGTSGRDDFVVLGRGIVAGPGEACTETYLVIDRFDDEIEAEHLAAYLSTRFVRFLVSLRKITQNMTRSTYAFVPDLPMDREWTDEALYTRYGLTNDEIAFIESQIKEMPTQGAFR